MVYMPITKKQVNPGEVKQLEPGEVVDYNVSVAPAEEDYRYYELAEPLQIGSANLSKLLIDKTEIKSGLAYFKLNERYQNENPVAYRNCINRLLDTTWMAYQIAELNPPMTLEDVYRIPFYDLEMIFARMPAVSFLTRTKKTETA